MAKVQLPHWSTLTWAIGFTLMLFVLYHFTMGARRR